ncbi:unnamed protein product [Polarella glacialis]|uniref:Uncharacterized protein n=1 Tax=Polarella glacialis TaxID=89957 RepID=A0A813KPL8_POLGL|nr:unnamed protein product [Polarella glacialis]
MGCAASVHKVAGFSQVVPDKSERAGRATSSALDCKSLAWGEDLVVKDNNSNNKTKGGKSNAKVGASEMLELSTISNLQVKHLGGRGKSSLSKASTVGRESNLSMASLASEGGCQHASWEDEQLIIGINAELSKGEFEQLESFGELVTFRSSNFTPDEADIREGLASPCYGDDHRHRRLLMGMMRATGELPSTFLHAVSEKRKKL